MIQTARRYVFTCEMLVDNSLASGGTLAQRIAAHDEAALQELYAACGQRLFAYALRLSEDPAAAGHVWTFTASGLEKPNHGLTIISMLHPAAGNQFRLVGQTGSRRRSRSELKLNQVSGVP